MLAQAYLDIPKNNIKATVLIETITASFQFNEIIYKLRNHLVGLNCGRWDCFFSDIKKFINYTGFMASNRDQVTMSSPFMTAYSLKVIQSYHRRNR